MRPRKNSRSLFVEALESRSLLAAITGRALTDDSYEGNDSFTAAKNLGTIGGAVTIPALVMADSYDWFKFTTSGKPTATSNVAINFQHAEGNLDLRLYSSSGRLLKRSDSRTNSESISLSGLAAGTYHARVAGYWGAFNPSYSLSVDVSGTTVPPPAPTDDSYENNDTLSTARDLGSLTSAATISSLVMADGHDWFRFAMGGTGTSTDYVSASFQNSQGNLDLELFNAGGTLLNGSSGAANSEQISLAGRAAGTYYVHILGVSGAANPSYSLQIDPAVATAPPVDPPPSPPPSLPGSFDIQFTFSGLSVAQQAIFEQAALKWESIIVGDLSNATYNGVAVDDVLIAAASTFIDGVSGILGQAGPDRFRTGSGLPYHGIMQFDSADVANMQNNGTLLAVIEHEMGHVLGVGTLWNSKGLLVGKGGSNPGFIGAQAVAAYNSIFGTSATAVPVENTGGSGTRDSHFREATFRTELMTGWVGPGTHMPISAITVGSLADIGYTVNMAAVDPYTPPSGSAALASLGSSTSAGNGSGSGNSSIEPLLFHQPMTRGQMGRWSRSLLTPYNAGDSTMLTSHEMATDAVLSSWNSPESGGWF